MSVSLGPADVSFADLEGLQLRIQLARQQLAEDEAGYCRNSWSRLPFNQRCEVCEARISGLRVQMRALYREMNGLLRYSVAHRAAL